METLLENHADLLRDSDGGRSHRELILDLNRSGSLAAVVADTFQFNLRQATRIAKIALEDDPTFDRQLIDLVRSGDLSSPDDVIRILVVLELICRPQRLLEHVLGLYHPDGRVRSKLTLLIGQLTRDPVWLRERLLEQDPRVRANAIEGFWDVPDKGLENLLRDAMSDPNHRVAVNAALALYKLGAADSIPALLNLRDHPDDLFRRAALWAIGQTRDFRFNDCLETHLPGSSLEERATIESVREELNASRAASAFAAHLNVEISRTAAHTSGRRSVELHCVSRANGDWLSGVHLKAVNFVITEGGRQINDYSFHWVENPNPMISVLVLPHSWSGNTAVLGAAFKHGLNREICGFLPYEAAPSYLGENEGDEEIQVRFEDWSKLCGERLERRHRPAKTLGQAISSGLKALHELPGERHLFIVADPTADSERALTEIHPSRQWNTTVHSVVWSGAPVAVTEPLRSLARRTGGAFVNATNSADFLNTLLSARAKHFASLELSWKSIAPHSKLPVSISCQGDFGYGEASTEF